jgi:hypothetical protein
VTDWTGLTAPPGAVALIAAECVRCYRVATKYWECDGEGRWITRNRDRHLMGRQRIDNAARLRNMVAERVCYCDPPPTLPEGGELARHITRARKQPPAPGNRRRPGRVGIVPPRARLTIRV